MSPPLESVLVFLLHGKVTKGDFFEFIFHMNLWPILLFLNISVKIEGKFNFSLNVNKNVNVCPYRKCYCL